MKTLYKNKQNNRVNFIIFSLTFLSSKVITVVKLIFALTETVLLNFGDFLLKSVNFDRDYLRYIQVFLDFYGYKLQNVIYQILLLRRSNTILSEHMKKLW